MVTPSTTIKNTVDGTQIESSVEVASAFDNLLSSVASSDVSLMAKQYTSSKPSFVNGIASCQQGWGIIWGLKPKRSADSNGMPVCLFKQYFEYLFTPLTKLIHKIIQCKMKDI